MKYVRIVSAVYLYVFVFTYSLFVIFHLPIPFYEEISGVTFVLAIGLLISALISLSYMKNDRAK